MTEGYVKIAELLTVTFTSSDDNARKQAELELKAFCQSPITMIEMLLRLCSENLPIQLKISAATKLRHLIRENIESSSFQPSDKSMIAEATFKVMILEIESVPRSILSNTLSTLLADDSTSIISSKLSILSFQYLNGSVSEIQSSLLCIRALFTNITTEFSTKDYFHKIIPVLTTIGMNTFNTLIKSLSTNDSELISKSLQILVAWSECLSQILEHFEMISPKILKGFLKQTEISALFGNIICFPINNNRIVICENSLINKQILLIKTSVLHSINILLQYTIDTKKKLLEEQESIKVTTLIGMNLPDSPFINVVISILEPLLINLLQLSTEVELASGNEAMNNFIIEAMDIASKCCGESTFFPVFLQYFKFLITKLIPNALHLTSLDKEQVLQSPNEFVDAGFDICERQESETVKTTAAKLLEILCDNIDGSLTFLVNTILTLLVSTLSGNNTLITEELSYMYSLDQESKIDCCILMLSTVSYTVSKRHDLLSLLNHFFTLHFSILVNANSDIIQSRLCLFYYFYAEHLHLEDDQQMIEWVWFLISRMTVNAGKATIIQASETFSSIVQDEETMLRLHPFLSQIFEKVVKCIEFQQEKSFFEALLEFFN